MNENNVNQNEPNTQSEGNGTQAERKFTQEDVNRIVSERLAKEKAKSSGEADFAKREQELAQRELRMTAKEMLSEKGLPVHIFDALNCTDKETMEKSIETIEKAFNECKANAAKPNFRGFQPGVSGLRPKVEASEDLEIRKAMGLCL